MAPINYGNEKLWLLCSRKYLHTYYTQNWLYGILLQKFGIAEIQMSWEAKEARKIQKKTANDAKFQNATPKISSKVDANKMTQIKIYAYLESFWMVLAYSQQRLQPANKKR